MRVAETRRLINRQIANAFSAEDDVSLAGSILLSGVSAGTTAEVRDLSSSSCLIAARNNREAEAAPLLDELDELRDDFDHRILADQAEMLRLAEEASTAPAAISGVLSRSVSYYWSPPDCLGDRCGSGDDGAVRPVRRLLAGTRRGRGGALDTVIPVTSRDGVGH